LSVEYIFQEKLVVPNIKSAIKRVKVAERNRLNNKTWRTAVRTARTEVVTSSSGTKDACQKALNTAYKVIDMAVSKGVLHKNAAARRKSRLAKTANVALAKKKK
jgi:small subunit ribosomal protein S20